METDVLGKFLNRILTHMVTGTIVLVVLLAGVYACSGTNVYQSLVSSQFSIAGVWVVFIMIFLLGGVVDSLALMLLDYFSLRRVLGERPSEVDITSEHTVQLAVEFGMLPDIEDYSNDLARVRQQLTDLVPALFDTVAPPHLYAKRDELDALYQYNSNMLLLLLVFLPLLPAITYRLVQGPLFLGILAVQMAVSVLFYRFTVNALKRLNSIEDRFFVGYLLDRAVRSSMQKEVEDAAPSFAAEMDSLGTWSVLQLLFRALARAIRNVLAPRSRE